MIGKSALRSQYGSDGEVGEPPVASGGTVVPSLAAMLATTRGEFPVRIHNLSTRGLMASADLSLAVGEQVEIRIDTLPWTRGQIRWVRGDRFGILLLSTLPVSAFRLADQRQGRQPRPTRFNIRLPVRIEATGIARSAMVHNISLHGLSLETGLPIASGKALTIHIDGLAPMTGRVRWSVGSRCGVMLESPLDNEVLDRITHQFRPER